MFGRINIKRGNRDQEEKPFWISFADLMTSLMVLFLVSLSVALLKAQHDTERAQKAEKAATAAQNDLKAEQEKLRQALAKLEQQERERDTRRERRAGDIATCHKQLDTIIARFNDGGDQGVRLDRARNVIDFGSRAEFEPGRHELRLEQAKALRDFSNRLVEVLNDELGVCRQWLRRVVVEGFTDNTGTYLYNLNLSLNRSQRVMCVLLSGEYATLRTVPKSAEPALFTGAPQRPVEIAQRIEPLPPEQQLLVKQLFLVGGYSSNSLKATPSESRRIELRIEFYQVDDERIALAAANGDTGRCSIGTR